jgi:uncharacterized membrane protein
VHVSVVDVLAGIPLILFLPGAALVWLVDAHSRHIQHFERQVWVVASSIGICILGGLLLNVTGGLTRLHWLLFIYGLVTVLTLAGWLREGPEVGQSVDKAQTSSRVSVASHADALNGDGRSRRIYLREVILLLAALWVVVAAVVLSVRTDSATSQEIFVQSWIVPKPVNNVASSSIQIGIRNHMGGRHTFVVRVTGAVGPATTSYRVPLMSGQSWVRDLSRYGDDKVTSTVALASRPSEILNRVYLSQPVP